jgi:creatinine amidohydrolase
MGASRYWMELTTQDVARLAPGTIAVLPVSAIEQHGPHMPLGTDALINRGLVARALELLPADVPVVTLPEQVIGSSSEHLQFPGTLSLGPAGTMSLWTTLLETCITRSSITKLLLFNSHGGQSRLLQPVALELRQRFGILAAYASWFDAGYPAGLFSAEELAFGIHAGAVETSMMMHLRPELVDHSELADFPSYSADLEKQYQQLQADPSNGRLGGFGWMMQDLNRFGAAGDATLSSPEAGRALVEHAAERLARLLGEIHRFDPMVLGSKTFLDRS